MSLFRRAPRALVPRHVIELLPAYGRASLAARRAGDPVTDPRFDWDRFLSPVHLRMASGQTEQVVQELHEAATSAVDRPTAVFGAYRLIAEFNPELDDRRFRALYDESLEHLRSLGFTSLHLTGFEGRRWAETRGDLRSTFDGLFAVEVPADEDAAVTSLAPGESRLLARTGPAPDGNEFYAEHQSSGTFVVYSMRPWDFDDRTLTRSEEDQLGTFDGLVPLMRALAEMFGAPPYWVDDELFPFFPLRRS